MSKKVFVIATSLRNQGNTDQMADEFVRGAKDAEHEVEKISLIDKEIRFCKGCLVCQQTKKCVMKDDVSTMIETMQKADVLVFATPIYFYEMCGQMKTLLDRTNPLYSAEYKFRDIYLLAACADTEETAIDGAIKGLQGWLDCFEKTKLAGVLCGYGADEKGSIRQAGNILKRAYEMGKHV